MNKDKLINFGLYCVGLLCIVNSLHNSGANSMLNALDKKGLKIVDEAGEVVNVGVKYFWNKK